MKLKIFVILICIQFFSVITSRITAQTKSEFEIGVGIVDISGDSAIILDPLHVKAVVFRQGIVQFALVECDVLEVSTEITIPAREYASLKTGIPFNNICIAATHTHMATEHKDIVPAVIQAISEAQAALQPVNFKTAIGQEFNVSFNRRYFMKDGTVVFNPMFLNPDIVRPVGPIDSEVSIVMFYSGNDKLPIVSLSNFALHLDIVKEYGAEYQKSGDGSRNSVSADYPYWMEQAFRKDFGNKFNSIFFTGCCGNINHWDFSKPGPQSGHKTKSKQVGDSLYSAIKRAIPNLKFELPDLATRSRVVSIPLQNYTDEDLNWAKKLEIGNLSSKSEEPNERKQFLNNVKMKRILWLDEQKQKGITNLPLDVQVFRLSNNTAIVTLPGEMFVEYGITIKNFSPFENTIIVEMANNYINYVPDKRAFPQGGYEVENSRIVPGGGETLAEAAIQMLKELKKDAQ